MSADNTKNLLGSASGILSTTILGNGGPAPSLSAVTFLTTPIQEPPSATASHASLSVCHFQPLPRTTAFLVMHKNCSRSIMMTDKDSLSHAAGKRTDTVFSNFTESIFPLQIAPSAFSIFDQFSSFHSLFRLCRSSFCS